MAQFMVTATYTDSAFAGMTTSPHNREEAIGKILSALNMNLESLHMTLGGKLFMADIRDSRSRWCTDDCRWRLWFGH